MATATWVSMAPGWRVHTEPNPGPGLTVVRPQCGRIQAPIKDPEVRLRKTYIVPFQSFQPLTALLFFSNERGTEQRQQR
jgi:hypothetical protein